MQRRSLLSLLSTASAAALAQPLLVRAAGVDRNSVPGHRTGDVLLLLELRGGNDGLNTVVPFQDPLYRQARPRLALDDVVPLAHGLGLHPALAPLLPLWRQKKLGFALGVGWPQPNRSHFKASDQWATANPSGEGIGWIAACFQRLPNPGPLVALDPGGCRAMEGGDILAIQLTPAQLRPEPLTILDPSAAGPSPILRQMLALEQAGQLELRRLLRQLAPLPAGLPIPRSGLGEQVAMALRLIGSGICPPVLQLAQGGYDTHANQAPRHRNQLAQLADALVALDQGLLTMAKRPRITLLAVSEFGRRLKENGSGGTDHGSASVALLYGDNVPHPFLGRYPRLDRLDSRGDLVPSITPLELYRQVLRTTPSTRI